MFQGSLVALVTPMKGGQIDYKKMAELVKWHIEEGTDGIVPIGTTGESPTVDFEEHEKVIDTVIDAAGGKVPVIPGTGGNSTAEAIRLTKHAREAGATATLQVCPYYNKPTQEGLYRHFAAIAEEADLPMVLYNIPGRTGISLTPETVARLAKLPQVVAIKEATGSLDQASAILSLCDLTILSGDDSLTLPLMSIGARGVVSVAANIVPGDVARMTHAFLDGDAAAAQAMHRKLFPLCRAMFVETNPIPVKAAMKMLGLLESEELRLPMCAISDAARPVVRKALADYGLLK
ncbi:MAG: 4-hydroxy-tetrahydrodipicolinate synthase [Phycisphaerae bacterium]|jgi:4-hydroxy-tetrahydrodipicolinate synthase|nr:4-hydroxy-tetrahydrodipicolinate synthase [Phycisphaerae bacterium]